MTVNHNVITLTNNNNTVRVKRQKSTLERLYQTRFHEAALWGAITFVREFTGNDLLAREVILSYQSYFGLDEDTFPCDCAYVQFTRVNKKIRAAQPEIRKDEPMLFKSEIAEEMREIKSRLDELLKYLNDEQRGKINSKGGEVL